MPILVYILLAATLLVSCTGPAQRGIAGKDPTADSVKPPERLEANFNGGAQVDFWMAETLGWRLVTDKLRQEEDGQKVFSKPVDLVAYGKDGKVAAHVTSDSGSMDRGMRFFRAWGHVVGSNVGGMELRTDSIIFDRQADRIHTEARVRVKTETGDILSGRGFRSDAYLNRWEILSDVTGSIRDLSGIPFQGQNP